MSSEKISTSALLNAIIALDSEISKERDVLEDRELDEAEQEAEEDTLGEMQSAFKEFVAVYEQRRKLDAKLPALSEVLGAEPELIA